MPTPSKCLLWSKVFDLLGQLCLLSSDSGGVCDKQEHSLHPNLLQSHQSGKARNGELIFCPITRRQGLAKAG